MNITSPKHPYNLLENMNGSQAHNAELEAREQAVHQAEYRLHASWRRLRKAEEVSHLGSWEMDIATGESEWSDEFYRICGLLPGSVPATTEEGMKLIHPDDMEKAIQELTRAIETGGHYSIEKRIVRPNGEVRYVQSVGEVLLNAQGQPYRLMGSFLDITERKLAEEALQQSLKELQVTNAELDAYAAMVAHDLRNPIHILLSYSDLLEENIEKLAPEEIKDILHIISQTGHKMASIVDALLLLAGVRNQNDVRVTPLNMCAIIDDVLFRFDIPIKDAQAVIHLPDTWPMVVGYGPWVEEVWANYMSNALKYSEGTPYIELGADEHDGFVRFWIRDKGLGLTPAQQAKLFIDFSRVHAGNNAEGHGLGLSIVRRIVERLGGRVGVESKIGEGSLFYFTLPCC